MLWGLYDHRCEAEVSFDILRREIEGVCNAEIACHASPIEWMRLENLTEYKRLAQLSLREKSGHAVFFAGAELIVWVSGLCATVFTKKADTLALLEKIAATEGLYLWKRAAEGEPPV